MMPEGKRTPAQWLKFANSLRLRLAMRVSNVAPELAEKQAKAALDAANGGVLETANETVGEYGIRNRYQEFWYITLPELKPQLMFGAVMSITGSFGMGDVLTGVFGFPSSNYALHTLVHHLQDYGNVRFEMGYACAIAVLLFILMVGANQIVQRLLRKVGD